MSRYPRVITYGAILAAVALYTIRATLYGGTAIGWLAVAVMVVGILHVATAHLIRETMNYYPAHRIEKIIAGASGVAGALGVWWGVDLGAFVLCAVALILVSSVIAFEFVLFKNAGMGDFVRTIFGLVPIPMPAEAMLHAEYTAALWRHGKIPAAGRVAIESAQDQGQIEMDEFKVNLAAQLERRRQLMAREATYNDILITDAEIEALIERDDDKG